MIVKTVFDCTVEHGYNDHGYSKYTAIANKISNLVWFSMFYQDNFINIANNFSKFHGYNKHFFVKKLNKIN